MKLDKYRVDLNFCYEQNGASSRNSGYEIVFSDSPENAKKTAKARAMESFKKQGCKIIFLDLKDAVRID
jgi:hypothetical protein